MAYPKVENVTSHHFSNDLTLGLAKTSGETLPPCLGSTLRTMKLESFKTWPNSIQFDVFCSAFCRTFLLDFMDFLMVVWVQSERLQCRPEALLEVLARAFASGVMFRRRLVFEQGPIIKELIN